MDTTRRNGADLLLVYSYRFRLCLALEVIAIEVANSKIHAGGLISYLITEMETKMTPKIPFQDEKLPRKNQPHSGSGLFSFSATEA